MRDQVLGKNWDSELYLDNPQNLGKGILSNDQIAMIQPTNTFKKASFSKMIKDDGKELPDFKLEKPINRGEFEADSETSFEKKYIAQAIKYVGKPHKVFFGKNMPLTIIGSNYTMLIAPKYNEVEDDYEDI